MEEEREAGACFVSPRCYGAMEKIRGMALMVVF